MNLYKQSLEKINENKSKVALIVLIEFAFLMLIFISGIFFYNRLLENYEIVQNLTYDFDQEQSLEDANIMQSKLLMLDSALNDITKNIAFFTLIIIFGTTFIIGYTSSLLNKIIYNSKINWRYFANFFLLFLFFSLILLVLITKLNSLLNTTKGSYLFLGILIVINYFVSICFALFLKNLELSKAIKGVYEIGIKKFSKVFVHYLIGIGIFLLFGYLLTFISKINSNISIIGSLFLILVFVWFRIFMIELCGKQDSNLRKH